MEVWKQIKDYPDYEFSNIGRVCSLKFNKRRIMKQTEDLSGYLKVKLCCNKKVKNIQVHILIAIAFHKNPQNKPEVNHKDRVKRNNSSINLEWATKEENMNHYKISNTKIESKIDLQIKKQNDLIEELSKI